MLQGGDYLLAVGEPHAVQVGVALEERHGSFRLDEALAVPGQHQGGVVVAHHLLNGHVTAGASVV